MQEQARGKVGQVIGKLRETAGKLTGDRSAEIGGKAQQIKGKAEEKIGDLERLIDDLERLLELAAGALRPQAHQSTGQFSKMRLFTIGCPLSRQSRSERSVLARWSRGTTT